MNVDIINAIGYIAAIFTTISVLPQAIKTIKSKETKDISFFMYAFLILGMSLWFIYGWFKNDAPIIYANGISLIFSSTVLGYKIKYK